MTKKYLFSFFTAVIYGITLDIMMNAVSFVPGEGISVRMIFYVLGLLFCAIGVSMFFHSYISPEAYEMFVKEIAGRYGFDINKTKTVYDCTSCAIAIVLSFIFFGFMHFEGVKAGTIICALVNGHTIGICSMVIEKRYEIKDRFPLRNCFDQ